MVFRKKNQLPIINPDLVEADVLEVPEFLQRQNQSKHKRPNWFKRLLKPKLEEPKFRPEPFQAEDLDLLIPNSRKTLEIVIPPVAKQVSDVVQYPDASSLTAQNAVIDDILELND